MHLLNRALLKSILVPKGLYKRMGIDPVLLRTILVTKLTIDDRRPNSMQMVRKRDDKPVNAATIGTVFMSALLGLLYLGAFFFSDDEATALLFYFSLFFFMLSASLISDFTSVLIDVRDNYIILPKPVNDRTVLMGRVLHIFIHVCKLVVPMCLPGAIYMAFNYGTYSMLPFLVMVLFLTLFVLFFINALYLLILRITTPRRFQSIISYVQIFFAIAIYAGYQVVPRLAGSMEGFSLDTREYPWVAAVPTYWFAAGWQVLYRFEGTSLQALAAALSVIVPLASIWIMIRYLAPSFNNKLSLISSASGDTTASSRKKKLSTHSRYLQWVSNLFTRRGPERMGFLFTWKMMARSRDFKIKVYPAIGYMAVYVFIILFRSDGNQRFEETDAQLVKGTVVGGLYITSYLLIVAVTNIRQSEKFKAGWIFFSTPLKMPGEVILGAVKAGIFRFYLPMVVVTSAVAFYFAGPAVVPNLVLGFFNQLLAVCTMVYMNQRFLPFTVPERASEKAGSFIKGMFLLLLLGIIGLAHWLVYDMLPAVLLFALLSIAATWYMMGSIRRTGWDKLRKQYENY